MKAAADMNLSAWNGATALHVAAFKGHARIVALLLANGADRACVAEGYTALQLAERRGHEACVATLGRGAPRLADEWR